MDLKKDHYSIGQFSRLSNTSIKQLRYLDKKGVLRPHLRDSDNQYRYYSSDQLETLIYIQFLRSLDISFEEIAHSLKHPDLNYLYSRLKNSIAQTEEYIRKAVTTYERKTGYLLQLVKSRRFVEELQNTLDPSLIEVVEIPRQKVIFTRYRSEITAYKLFTQRFTELQTLCDKTELFPTGGMFALFHDHYMAQFTDVAEDVEIFFPLEMSAQIGENIREFGGFQAVTAVHLGHYSNMMPLYTRMAEWAREQGVEIMKQSVEQYLLGPDMTNDPEQYVTRLYLPFAGSEI